MLSAMNGQHYDLVAHRSKVDGVRKPRQHRAANLAVNTVEHEGVRCDSADEVVDRHAEFVPESGPARFVPCLYFARVVCGLRPKDNLPDRHLRQQLRAHVGPGNRRRGISNVLGPPAVEVSALFIAERKFALTLTFREAVPERQRELGPIGCRQLEQLDEGTRWHIR
jgi:hypothetical protein